MRDKDDESVGHWAIVDCTPEDTTFCGDAVHEALRRPHEVAAHTTCPWSNINIEWEFCVGEKGPEGCSEYETDSSLHFTSCVEEAS